jgi:predicted transglutaminase-like cysteine proteinase
MNRFIRAAALLAAVYPATAMAVEPDTAKRYFAQKWEYVKPQIEVFSLTSCQEPACAYFRGYRGTPQEIVERVNADVNMLVTYDDEGPFVDYWQMPLETIKSGKGDCEDYAILKIAILRYYGIESRLMTAQIKTRFYHAIAIARVGNDWIALDNVAKNYGSLSRYPLQPHFVGALQSPVTGGR